MTRPASPSQGQKGKKRRDKKPARGSREFIPADPDSPDPNVTLPLQVRLAVERAEALVTGRQPRPIEVDAASTKRGFPFTDAQIAAVRAWLEAKADPADPVSVLALEMFRKEERTIKARRRGAAQQPRKVSDAVTRRLEALLQAFRELPSGLQKRPTGTKTVERLRNDLIKKLGLPDNDDDLSEETIRKHIIQDIRPLIWLVQTGKMPPPGQPQPEVTERIRRQVKAEKARRTKLGILRD
jgi:hypothetical protein